MRLISLLITFAFGVSLARMGHPIDTKEYWILLTMYIAYGAVRYFEGSRNETGN